ncbi:MAG: hypothetical protein ACYDH2_05705 [Anaerolineaceae bacterium]
MQNKRQIGFMIAILVGLFAGLIIGWLLIKTPVRNASLDSLRGDYQADYVLMVAEKFAVDQDLLTAAALLREISPSDPSSSIKEALILGQQLGYSQRELQLITLLQTAIGSSSNAAPVTSTAEVIP